MITVSPGHWGKGTGAKGFLDEGVENIKVAERVVAILRSSGITTNYIQDTTNKNQTNNVNWLIAQHNKTSRSLDCQIHFNASGGTHSKGIGTEVLVKDRNLLSVANRISSAVSIAGEFMNRGGKVFENAGILNRTNKQAVLIEVCFVNDSVDSNLYKNNFESICQAIAKSLANAVGKDIQVTKNNYDVVNDKGAKFWRIQSGWYDSEEKAIAAFKETGLRYATIKGTVQ